MAKPRASAARERRMKDTVSIPGRQSSRLNTDAAGHLLDKAVQFLSPFPPKDSKFRLGVPPVAGKAVSLGKAMKIEETGKFLGRIFNKTFHKMKGGKVMERTSVRTSGGEGSFAGFKTVNKVKSLSEVPKKIQKAAGKK